MQGRLIDIPYYTSPPVIFTFRQTAALAGGGYDFSAGGTQKIAFTPNRPIMRNILYIGRSMSFAMDISSDDYYAAIVNQPSFNAYVQSEAGAPAFREPIILAKYFDNLPYDLAFMGSQTPGNPYPGSAAVTGQFGAARTINRLLGNVAGSLIQTGALMGKTSITAIIMISAQEIVDEEYIKCFRQQSEARKAIDLANVSKKAGERLNPGRRMTF